MCLGVPYSIYRAELLLYSIILNTILIQIKKVNNLIQISSYSFLHKHLFLCSQVKTLKQDLR